MTCYKVLFRDGNKLVSGYGGKQEWTPGQRISVKGDLVPCRNGVHICRDELDLLHWLGEVICPVVSASKEGIDSENKRTVRWAVIGEPNPYWNENASRKFAAYCGKGSPPWEAIWARSYASATSAAALAMQRGTPLQEIIANLVTYLDGSAP